MTKNQIEKRGRMLTGRRGRQIMYSLLKMEPWLKAILTGNKEQYHSAIGYVTPEQQHAGQADMILKQRKKQLAAARKN